MGNWRRNRQPRLYLWSSFHITCSASVIFTRVFRYRRSAAHSPTLTLPRKRRREWRGGCHKAVFDVARDCSGVALGGVSPASATAGFQDQHVGGVDHQAGLLGSNGAGWLAVGVEGVT